MFGASSGTVFIEETRSLSGFGSFAQSPEGYETEEERDSRRTQGMALIGVGAIGALGGLVLGVKKSKLGGGALALVGLAAAGFGAYRYGANKNLMSGITASPGRTEVKPPSTGISFESTAPLRSSAAASDVKNLMRNIR